MIYVLQFSHQSNASPADGSTNYFSRFQSPSSIYDNNKIVIPVAGRIVRVDFKVRVDGVLGSGELGTFSVRINDTTDVGAGTLALTAIHNYAFAVDNFAVAAGDLITAKYLAPTWVTNPTSLRFYASAVVSHP